MTRLQTWVGLASLLVLSGCSSKGDSLKDAGPCAVGDPGCEPADTTPPVISGDAPSGILPAGTTSATLSVTTDEPATCRYDLAVDLEYVGMSGTFATTGGTAHSVLLTGLSDGQDYAPYVRCIDAAGNANATGYRVVFGVAPADALAPVISDGAPTGTLPEGTTSVQMSVATDEPATCKWDPVDTTFALMASEFSLTGGTSHQTTLSGLTDGQSYTRSVRCADTAGNVSTTSYLITFNTAADTTPPVIDDGAPSGIVAMGTVTATLSVTTNEPATCKWGLSAATTFADLANTFTTTGGTSHSATLSGLADGQSYSRSVRCRDAVGNANATSYLVSFSVATTVDTTPPVISNGLPSGALAAGTRSVVLRVTTDEAATCKWGYSAATGYAGLPNTFTTTGGTVHRVTLSGLADGMTYDRYVRCSDPSGNVNTSSYTVSFSVESIKRNYGHYVATKYTDTPADVARLCEQPGVTGVNWRRTWFEVEDTPGHYQWGSFDAVLAAIAASRNPQCQLWLFIEWKSFASSPVKNPCPAYLQANYSALNAAGNGAKTCFMWEPVVRQAYGDMIAAAGARYDGNPRVEGVIFQETALSLNGAYSQPSYRADMYRDTLVNLINRCGAAFPHSRCLSFANFIAGGNHYLYDVSAALRSLSGNRGCLGGPDLLPGNSTLYLDNNRVYEVLMRHNGCRSNSAQNDSFDDDRCTVGGVPSLQCIFNFGVRGTFGDFNDGIRSAVGPRDPSSGVCINSYLFWNNRASPAPRTGFTVDDALRVIAANPYGTGWYGQCAGGGVAP